MNELKYKYFETGYWDECPICKNDSRTRRNKRTGIKLNHYTDYLLYTKHPLIPLICLDCLIECEKSDPDFALGIYSTVFEDYNLTELCREEILF